MATNLPALAATTHAASVMYACTFGLTRAPTEKVSFQVPAPVQFEFSFDTGFTQPDPAVDLRDVVTDTSWFDQDATEAGIKTAMAAICTAIAALLGVDAAQIENTVTIRRTWKITANQVGSAAPVVLLSSPVVYTEVMPYP
jgi:hypothetical protein